MEIRITGGFGDDLKPLSLEWGDRANINTPPGRKVNPAGSLNQLGMKLMAGRLK
ncbi:MAG: hypothetical protein AAFZ49_03220 [Cyanobacteria bacterium J06659_2]